MMLRKLMLPLAVLTLWGTFTAQSKDSPFACNLKAFQPGERARWNKLIHDVTSSVTTARELSDGYALQIDRDRVSIVSVAEWIDLERKCCPFFEFQLDQNAENGSLWLTLKGRPGVKEFIRMDFTLLQSKLTGARNAR